MSEKFPSSEGRERMVTYEELQKKIRALKDDGIDVGKELDDPRSDEVWRLIDAYAEQEKAGDGHHPDASEKLALLWIENGWDDDFFFLDKASEDIENDLANAEQYGDIERARHLQEKLDEINAKIDAYLEKEEAKKKE